MAAGEGRGGKGAQGEERDKHPHYSLTHPHPHTHTHRERRVTEKRRESNSQMLVCVCMLFVVVDACSGAGPDRPSNVPVCVVLLFPLDPKREGKTCLFVGRGVSVLLSNQPKKAWKRWDDTHHRPDKQTYYWLHLVHLSFSFFLSLSFLLSLSSSSSCSFLPPFLRLFPPPPPHLPFLLLSSFLPSFRLSLFLSSLSFSSSFPLDLGLSLLDTNNIHTARQHNPPAFC